MILYVFLIGPKNPIRGCSLVPDGLAQLWLIVLSVSRPEQLLHTDCSAAERSQAQNHTRQAGPSKGIAKVHATNQCLQNGKSGMMGHTDLTGFQATESSRSASHNTTLFCELWGKCILPNTSPSSCVFPVRQVPVFHHGSNADRKNGKKCNKNRP